MTRRLAMAAAMAAAVLLCGAAAGEELSPAVWAVLGLSGAGLGALAAPWATGPLRGALLGAAVASAAGLPAGLVHGLEAWAAGESSALRLALSVPLMPLGWLALGLVKTPLLLVPPPVLGALAAAAARRPA